MPGGRPTKYSAEIVENICSAIKRGHYLEHAAALAGITGTTADNWIALGKAGEEPYTDFLAALKRAEADSIERALLDIESAEGGKDARPWTNRAWWLERRHPRLFGRQIQEVEHTGTVTTQVIALESGDSIEALKAARDAARKG